MDDVLVGSRVFCCSCIIVFMRACYPVPLSLVSGAGASVHTWVDEELRVIGQHVAVNIKNPNRSWVHNLDPQQESTFLSWTGGLGSIRGVVLGHLARTKMRIIWSGSFAGRCCGTGVYTWGILCLLSGAWCIRCRAAVLSRFVAKPCERGFLFEKIGWCLMMKRIRGRSLVMRAVELVGAGLVAAEILGGEIVVVARQPQQLVILFVLQSSVSEETSWETATSERGAEIVGEARCAVPVEGGGQEERGSGGVARTNGGVGQGYERTV